MRINTGIAGNYPADLGTFKAMLRELNRIWSPPVVFTEDADMTPEHFAVVLDGTLNDVEYTLLDPTEVDGMIVMVKCKDVSNTVTAYGLIHWTGAYTFTVANEAIIMKASKSEESWLIFSGY